MSSETSHGESRQTTRPAKMTSTGSIHLRPPVSGARCQRLSTSSTATIATIQRNRFSPTGVARSNSSPRSPRKSADPSRPRASLVRLLIASYESRVTGGVRRSLQNCYVGESFSSSRRSSPERRSLPERRSSPWRPRPPSSCAALPPRAGPRPSDARDPCSRLSWCDHDAHRAGKLGPASTRQSGSSRSTWSLTSPVACMNA